MGELERTLLFFYCSPPTRMYTATGMAQKHVMCTRKHTKADEPPPQRGTGDALLMDTSFHPSSSGGIFWGPDRKKAGAPVALFFQPPHVQAACLSPNHTTHLFPPNPPHTHTHSKWASVPRRTTSVSRMHSIMRPPPTRQHVHTTVRRKARFWEGGLSMSWQPDFLTHPPSLWLTQLHLVMVTPWVPQT